jgi:hypothetical protein
VKFECFCETKVRSEIMKSKILVGFFILLVSIIMLTSNASASGWPVAWVNQATLSIVDSNPSQDPENSGFGTTQVVVWEEWNGNDWDIWMKYSLFDGLLGTWVFPVVQPATTPLDEINPAVTITAPDPVTGATWIHVVYQCWNPVGFQWDVCHVFTTNFGGAWGAPTVLDAVPANDAIDPAIVYTEDTSTPNGATAMLVQMVWSEHNPQTGFYEIQYMAFYLDTNRAPLPITGYIGTFMIRGVASGATGHCLYPEIASVDENAVGGTCQYYFSVVWQEQTVAGQWNIWYDDGTTTTIPGLMIAMTPGSVGQLNTINNLGDCYHPDIAATQDYQATPNYYYHVIWVFNIWGPPMTWQIDSCYATPGAPNPGAAAFTVTTTYAAVSQILDNPTAASKLTGLGPTLFDTWMAWEDSTNPLATNPDIWFRVSRYTTVPPGFAYRNVAARVGYLPAVGAGSIEHNPEFWNRNDAARAMPPLTHLVFDQTISGFTEVEYIDP